MNVYIILAVFSLIGAYTAHTCKNPEYKDSWLQPALVFWFTLSFFFCLFAVSKGTLWAIPTVLLFAGFTFLSGHSLFSLERQKEIGRFRGIAPPNIWLVFLVRYITSLAIVTWLLWP